MKKVSIPAMNPEHNYDIEIFMPDQENWMPDAPDRKLWPVVWLHSFAGEGEKIWKLSNRNFILLCVTGMDWNRDLSPWPAARVFSSGEDFGGNAKAYMQYFTEMVIPRVEGLLDSPVSIRGIVGYSMAGLFAAYAVYHSSLFSFMGTMSGSLWFDDWQEYALSHKPAGSLRKIYVSLGSKEHRTKNPRMARVRQCTDTLAKYWRSYGEVLYEINPGGHFNQPEARVARGIDWLAERNHY